MHVQCNRIDNKTCNVVYVERCNVKVNGSRRRRVAADRYSERVAATGRVASTVAIGQARPGPALLTQQ